MEHCRTAPHLRPGGWGRHSFDGTDDYITVPDSSSMDLTTAFTIGAWIRVSGFTSTHATIIAKGDYTWRLQRSFSGNTLLFGTGDWNTGPWDDLSGGVNVNDGQWHHVAAVFDGATKIFTLTGSSMFPDIGPTQFQYGPIQYGSAPTQTFPEGYGTA